VRPSHRRPSSARKAVPRDESVSPSLLGRAYPNYSTIPPPSCGPLNLLKTTDAKPGHAKPLVFCATNRALIFTLGSEPVTNSSQHLPSSPSTASAVGAVDACPSEYASHMATTRRAPSLVSRWGDWRGGVAPFLCRSAQSATPVDLTGSPRGAHGPVDAGLLLDVPVPLDAVSRSTPVTQHGGGSQSTPRSRSVGSRFHGVTLRRNFDTRAADALAVVVARRSGSSLPSADAA